MAAKGVLTTAHYMIMDDFMKLTKGLHSDKKYIWELYCRLSFYTGLRSIDVRSLRWKEVLNKNLLIKIERKTGKTREIQFNDLVKENILQFYKLLGEPDKNQYIFLSPRGGNPYTIHHINRQLKYFRFIYKVDVQKFSTHSFRKTFGRFIYDSTEDKTQALVNLNDIFNHSSFDKTRRYIGLQQDDIKRVYDSIPV